MLSLVLRTLGRRITNHVVAPRIYSSILSVSSLNVKSTLDFGLKTGKLWLYQMTALLINIIVLAFATVAKGSSGTEARSTRPAVKSAARKGSRFPQFGEDNEC